MAKYSFEFKEKVVQEYLKGEGSYVYLASQYNMLSTTSLKKWVKAYDEFGDEGLMRSRQINIKL